MRFHHDGTELNPPVRTDADGKSVIKLPPMLSGGAEVYVPCEPGSVCFTWNGNFYTVPKGGYVDIPEPVNPQDIVNVAKHLCPDDEWKTRTRGKQDQDTRDKEHLPPTGEKGDFIPPQKETSTSSPKDPQVGRELPHGKEQKDALGKDVTSKDGDKKGGK